MFFKLFDNFLVELKKIISFVSFFFIALSIFMFIYWFLFALKLQFSSNLNTFVWHWVDYIAIFIKDTAFYRNNTDILPVFASVGYAFVAYLLNCFIIVINNLQIKYKEWIKNYKLRLENEINNKLQADLVSQLKKSELIIVKVKITVEKQDSYLDTSEDEVIDTKSVMNNICNSLIGAMNRFVIKKGKDHDSVVFVLDDCAKSKDFFLELVDNASKIIKAYLEPKLNISFSCIADVFDDISLLREVSEKLDKPLALNIQNKIVVTPKFKLVFDNLYSNLYYFKVIGEYSVEITPTRNQTRMLYSLHKR